jgi:hypothetical protein
MALLDSSTQQSTAPLSPERHAVAETTGAAARDGAAGVAESGDQIRSEVSSWKIGGDDGAASDRSYAATLIRAGTVISDSPDPKLTIASGFTTDAGLRATSLSGDFAGAWQQSTAFMV